MLHKNEIIVGDGPLTIEQVFDIAVHRRACRLSDQPEFIDKINRGVTFLDQLLDKEGEIYGVTTGYGDSCTRGVRQDLVHELPIHLSRFHGCGLGDVFSPEITRAILTVRLASLCRGMSGVSMDLLRMLETLINQNILPIIPQEGSVGASGDLTPLSYVAAVLMGEREVLYQGQRRPTEEVFKELEIDKLTMRPKEALAVMNGTAVMTGVAVFAFQRADYLARLCSRLTSMTSLGILGNPEHFSERLFQAKPHPGQAEIARRIREDLGTKRRLGDNDRLQDRYSIRCAPHVIGVLQDMLPTFQTLIETELNSANDNPIVDGDGERILHGGHFYGGHIAFVMDGMKSLIANMADLIDRQMASLVDVKFNNGLPANLSGAEGDRMPINHGLKAVQIGVSAWTAEALKNTMPASVFSRSTECHNQDKVSMGTIAARDCLRVLDLSEQVCAGHLLATCQALRLRLNAGELSAENLTSAIDEFLTDLEGDIPFINEDQPLEGVLRHLVAKIQNRGWALYE